MAQINFPTATAAGQEFEADTGVIYTYVGTPPNGYWKGSFQSDGIDTLDNRYVEKTGDTMTGALLLNNASSTTAPDLSFSGDLNTGIYSPGADQVAITTNGTGRLFVKSNGDVGIGTANPSYKLDVKGDIAANANDGSSGAQFWQGGALELWRSDANSFIDFKSSPSDDFDCRIQQQSDGIVFFTGGNGSAEEQMRIDSSGNVGIGGTPPSPPNISLNADGSATFADNVELTDGTFISNRANGGSKSFTAVLNGNEKAVITAGGSATFDGQVSSSSVIQTSRFGTNVQLGASSFDAFRVGSEATGTVKLKYDGTGEFAGDVKAGGRDPNSTSTRGVRLATDSNNGGCYVQAKGSSNESSFMAFQALHGTTEKFKVMYDGSSIFAGGQAVINNAGVLDIQSTTAAADASTLFRCGSANVTGGANAFVVTANGGGTFVGDVKIGGTLPSSPNISLSSGGAGTFTGYIASDRGPNDALPCFVARKNGTDNAYIYNDGSAKFKGAVTVDRAAGACLEIKQAGVSKIYLDSSGYVGIGGTPGDPALTNIKFESNGNATFSGNVTAANIGAFKSSLTAAATSATTLADLKTAIINALANL